MSTCVIRHVLPGRVRLRVVPADRAAQSRLVQRVKAWPRARSVDSRPDTGSVLVHHEGTLPELQDWLEGTIEVRDETHPPVPGALLAASSRVARVDGAVKRATHGALDLRTGIFAALAGAALVQALRGQVFGPTTSLLSFGFGVLSMSREGLGLPPLEETDGEDAPRPRGAQTSEPAP